MSHSLTPNALAHHLSFTHINTPDHPDKDLLQKKITVWKKLDTIPTNACHLATSKRFTADRASCLLQTIDALETSSTLGQRSLALLDARAFFCSALDLSSTLPEHHAKVQKSSLAWLNLELPNTKRISHCSSKLTDEQEKLIKPNSLCELNVAKLPTEKKLSFLTKALDWMKTPLTWITTHTKWLPEKAQLSLPKDTQKLMQKTLQGIPCVPKNHLGKGKFGSVAETHIGDSVYAQKTALPVNASKRFQREGCAYMAIPSHPHLVSLEGINTEGLLLEKVSGGTLHDKIKDPTMTSKELIGYCLHVASALSHLHKCGFTYKDLKPDNVLVNASSKTAKLCDLGLIATTRGDKDDAGSPYFKAPEIYSERTITTRADSWSFGIMLYELLTGCIPFPRDTDSKGNPTETIEDYKTRQYHNRYMLPCPDTIFSRLSESGKNRMNRLTVKKSHFVYSSCMLKPLIKGCLHGNPNERLSMEQIHDTLIQCQALCAR